MKSSKKFGGFIFYCYLCIQRRNNNNKTTMVNLIITLSLYNDLQFPDYVWINDERTDEGEGYEFVNVSVNDDDYEVFVDFLNADEMVIAYEVY